MRIRKHRSDLKGPHIKIDIFTLAIFETFKKLIETGVSFNGETKLEVRQFSVWDDDLKKDVLGADLFFNKVGQAAICKSYNDCLTLEKIVYNILKDETILKQVIAYLINKSKFEKMKNDFRKKLEELIEYIELDNNIKGKCEFCPTLFKLGQKPEI